MKCPCCEADNKVMYVENLVYRCNICYCEFKWYDAYNYVIIKRGGDKEIFPYVVQKKDDEEDGVGCFTQVMIIMFFYTILEIFFRWIGI